jgi:type I restriction enzyme M protein
MDDYLKDIADARADIARLKGEKEAFEQSNPPDDADEEELANWNYARDLYRQMKELRGDNRDALKELVKRERAAAMARTIAGEKRTAEEATAALQPLLDQLAALEATLAPYEQIKTDLAPARSRYRELTNTFADELKSRCGILGEDEKRALVLELFAEDVQAGLDGAVSEKRQQVVRFLEGLWDKYQGTLTTLRNEREALEGRLAELFLALRYQ